MVDACADSEVVAAWISGRLDSDGTAALEAHADRCEACLQVLAAVGKLCADPHSRALGESHGAPALAKWAMLLAAPSPMPAHVSRYTLRGVLATGGFGVVYDAHDRELDRPVAIKAVGTGRDDGALRAAARALAALSHPNVVAVYDVVESHGQVFLVMEQIHGETLRQWQRRHRTAAQILARYQAAAAGLVAIHDAGLVHADIKPENLLIADDGRVLVADFGLLRGGPGPIVGGTPRYMAPEQAAGRTIDARADQYAFCVALHEALHGALPGQMALRTPPRRVRAVLQRGLQRDPARRWPSMASLAVALRAAAEPAPRWWPAAAVLAAVVAVAPWASTSSSAAPAAADEVASIEAPRARAEASPTIERAIAQRTAGDLAGALVTLLRADLLAAMLSIDLAEGDAETPATLDAGGSSARRRRTTSR